MTRTLQSSSLFLVVGNGPAAMGISACALGVTLTSLFFLWREQKRSSRMLQRKDNTKSNKKKSDCIYLDYNGTTPVYPLVIQAMMPFLEQHFGNPSSGHFYGQTPRQAVDQARQDVLKLLRAASSSSSSKEDIRSIWFTACGTEADNLAIRLALQSTQHLFSSSTTKLPHIVTCNVEHPAVEGCLKVMEEEEKICRVTYVPVQKDGRVRAQDMIQAIVPGHTVLVTLMLANNETGALQPVKQVAEYCRRQGILFHTDAAQAAGKVSVALSDLGEPDMVSLVGHKLGAPKGIACLYVRPGCLSEHKRSLEHEHGIMLIGGGQEFGRRGGTENVPYIVGFGAACAQAAQEYSTNAVRMEDLRCRLLSNLEKELGKDLVRANGPTDPHDRLPNTLSVGLKGVHSGELLATVCDQVAASAGATCHSTAGISSVLQAMHIPTEWARGTLRLSVGPHTTTREVDQACTILAQAARKQLASKPQIVRL